MSVVYSIFHFYASREQDKTALFVCHGGGKKKSLDIFKALLPGNEIIAEADFIYPLKNSGEVKRQIIDWVKELKGK